MSIDEEWYEFAKREKNFYGEYDKFEENVFNCKDYYCELCDIKKQITTILDNNPEWEQKQKLENAFKKAYNYVTWQHLDFTIFSNSFDHKSVLYDKVYEACLFTTLCIYISHSNRITGKSLSDFYRDNFVQLDVWNQNKIGDTEDFFRDVDALRQHRHRLFKERAVYFKQKQWSGMPIHSEHEWKLYKLLDPKNKEKISDTNKRLGNLYNDINEVLKSPKDKEYAKRVEKAYEKFFSKLNKIQYENFLNLCKFAISHICEDKKYYGMNIYRLEKLLSPYKISYEVNRLLKCKNEVEKQQIWNDFYMLQSIHYTKLYNTFTHLLSQSYQGLPCQLPFDDLKLAIGNFHYFLEDVVYSARLIIDELVEKNYFGENWEDFFLNTVNDMTERVFYNPDELDYTVTTQSQENYVELLDAFTRYTIEFYSKYGKEGILNI